MLRDIKISDLVRLEQIHEANETGLPMPNLSSPIYFIKKAIVDDEGNLIGSVLVKMTCEVGLILDKVQPNITRAKAIKAVSKELLTSIPAAGVQDAHVLIMPESNTAYAEILKKHLGMRNPEGIHLYREF
jgi:hypothetical protein